MDIQAANTPPQSLPAIIFPVFTLGMISLDRIFWVPFLLITALILAVVVSKEMVFSFRLEVTLVIYILDFKELAHNSWQLWRLSNSKFMWWASRLEIQGDHLQFKFKVSLIA